MSPRTIKQTDVTDKMNLDLNEFIEQIHQWKNVSQNKHYEIENLQKLLTQATKRNEILENTRSNLLTEVSELNIALNTLQKSLAQLDDYEAEKNILLKDRQELKSSLESLEKLQEEKKLEVQRWIEQLKQEHKVEMEKAIATVKNDALKHQKSLQEKLENKEKCINDMTQQMLSYKAEKDQDELKLKIQYEDKIGKLKQQISKSKMLEHKDSPGAQMHNIFRQKYLSLEKEFREEIARLKDELKSKDVTIQALKSKNDNSPLSSVIMATNTTKNVSLKKDFVNLESPVTYLNASNTSDDGDFTLKRKKMSKIEPMQVQKRKLFNLDQNFYAKS